MDDSANYFARSDGWGLQIHEFVGLSTNFVPVGSSGTSANSFFWGRRNRGLVKKTKRPFLLWHPICYVISINIGIYIMITTAAGKFSILIVDDDKSYRSLLRTVFSDNDFCVETAEDGSRALNMLGQSSHHYDLVITDLQMPNVDGLELIDQIREHFPDTRIIAMSAYMDDDRYGNVLGSNDFHCLTKPFRLAEVMNLARSILNE